MITDAMIGRDTRNQPLVLVGRAVSDWLEACYRRPPVWRATHLVGIPTDQERRTFQLRASLRDNATDPQCHRAIFLNNRPKDWVVH